MPLESNLESRVEQTNKKRTDVVKGNRVRERVRGWALTAKETF